MPRPQQPTREPMPEIKLRPLYRAERKRFVWLLGPDPLPDRCVEAIATLIACHKAACSRPKGHTKAKWAAALYRAENLMRRGHDGPEVTRVFTNPLFGVDEETFELRAIIGNPEVPLDRRLAVMEARRHELETQPEVDARHSRRVQLMAYALESVWRNFAVDRCDVERAWQFVLAIVEVAEDLPPSMRKNPKRLNGLRADISRMLLEATTQPAAEESATISAAGSA
jgi:hypothetical protein